MIFALSSLALERRSSSLTALLTRVRQLGYTGVEINVGTPILPLDGHSRRQLGEWRRALGALGFERVSLHAPATDLNPISTNEAVRALTFDQYCKSALLAREVGATTLTVHLGVGGWPGFPRDLAFRLCVDFFSRLLEAMGEGGPRLALENVAWGYRDPFPDVDAYVRLLDGLDASRVGFTLDLGHAGLAGLDAVGFVSTLGRHVLNIHAHRNDGREDWHWPVTERTPHVARLADVLASARFQGMIVHECAEDPGPADAFAALWARSPGT